LRLPSERRSLCPACPDLPTVAEDHSRLHRLTIEQTKNKIILMDWFRADGAPPGTPARDCAQIKISDDLLARPDVKTNGFIELGSLSASDVVAAPTGARDRFLSVQNPCPSRPPGCNLVLVRPTSQPNAPA